MGKHKYNIGQNFKTKVNQCLVLNTCNGIPVPFAQVSDFRKTLCTEIPAGTLVTLATDFQAQDNSGSNKRAYIMKVVGSPIYFVDHVLTRKYEMIADATNSYIEHRDE